MGKIDIECSGMIQEAKIRASGIYTYGNGEGSNCAVRVGTRFAGPKGMSVAVVAVPCATMRAATISATFSIWCIRLCDSRCSSIHISSFIASYAVGLRGGSSDSSPPCNNTSRMSYAAVVWGVN